MSSKDDFVAWGWRIRRDILAIELFLKEHHGSVWERFSAGWDLRRDMPTEESKAKVKDLLEALGYPPDPATERDPSGGHGGRTADPGAPPMPPLI
jgi:hypothetical protein